MQEILSSMRVIKFYAWESAFLDKITSLRVAEMKIVRFLLITRSAVNAVSITIPVFATILAFVTYSLTGHNLSAGTVFSSLTLFNLLRMPLMFLPLVFSSMTDAQIALNRIQDMLSAEEIDQQFDNNSNNEDDLHAIIVKAADFFWESEALQDTPKRGTALEMKTPPKSSSKSLLSRLRLKGSSVNTNLSGLASAQSKTEESDPVSSFGQSEILSEKVVPNLDATSVVKSQSIETLESPSSGRPAAANESTIKQSDAIHEDQSSAFAIRNISFDIKKGELVAIVGTVGSGKSSILSALVGEMRKGPGLVRLSGTIGFCAQVPWIMNATVRENILFGRPYDKVRYDEIVYAAALEHDFEVLPNGDETEIGERGITISGGQKQRINVARAAYHDADIVLLDDPLSAVDAHVGKHLFEKCILGVLGSKTRLLVTHQLNFLPQVDRILVIKEGIISEQGSYADLIREGQEFGKILHDFGSSTIDSQHGASETMADTVSGIELNTEKHDRIPIPARPAEDRETGAVSRDVYKDYFVRGGGLWTLPLLLAIVIVAQVAQVG